MLQPYWSPSNGDGPETRGAVIGFNEIIQERIFIGQ